MNATHTPGKLTVSYDGKLLAERQGCSHAIVAEMPVWFADKRNQGHATQDHQEANAARLAHCWNCHDELAEAAKTLVEFADRNNSINLNGLLGKAVEQARAALAKAGKE